jgi:pyruvate formate lyase activating enzyme
MAGWEDLASVAPLADLFLYDLKFSSDAKHRQHTGVSNRVILENLRRLAQIHPAIWIRVPLIPRLNDDAAELEAIAAIAKSIPSVRQVNLLPFHRTGVAKVRRLGQEPLLADCPHPSEDSLSAALVPFQRHGLLVKLGG